MTEPTEDKPAEGSVNRDAVLERVSTAPHSKYLPTTPSLPLILHTSIFLNSTSFNMAAEEAQKAEVEPECPPEPPPAAAPEVEEKAIIPLEPPPLPVSEEKPVDDSKAIVPVEKPTEDKPAEGSVNRDAVLERVSTAKKDALIKAWEESEKSKAENKAQQKLSTIGAWENSKKADLEAELRNIEENLEKKKAKYIEKQKNKIALLHKQAEEKRAMTEAKRGENLLKAEEGAAKWRATGTAPKKGWFSS